jgi:type IV pilus assembly protein PilW
MKPVRLAGAAGNRQRGAGMVETMIGILIGLLVVLVVYNLLAVAEGYRRATTGASDAQITGLLSQFVMGQDAGNGGNGLTSGFTDLVGCNKTEADAPYVTDIDVGTATLKPIPVLIYKGVAATDSDSFVSRLGTSPHVVWPIDFRLPSPLAGQNIVVQSPLGYSTTTGVSLPTAASPFWAVAIANDGTGRCALIQVTNASAPDAATGEVSLTQGTLKTTVAYTGVPVTASTSGSRLLNLGRDASRTLYDIGNDSLRVTDCLALQTCQGAAANPIAQNVVWMKVQYGIDTSQQNANGTLDGAVDCWTPADDSTCTATNRDGTTYSDWSPASIIKAGDPSAVPLVRSDVINRIVAIRIAMVVRSDEPDLRNASLYAPTSTTPDGVTGTRPALYLFNCAANTDAGCQNRVLVPAGAPSATGKADCVTTSNTVLCDGWRYRAYEAVIPLRNTIYNATLIP